MLMNGAKLGPYEILSPAGAGGMGEVYRARDTRLERTVAIKVLPPHLISNPDVKQRFEREARAISQLQHPHICVLHDIGRDEPSGTDYLVLEYLEGETLSQRLGKGPLPLDQVLKIGIEIAEALDKAHKHGVVHRDLKPGNIMLTRSGAKLLDFGLAKPSVITAAASAADALAETPTVTGPTAPMTPITTQGSVIGTFQYMSPEQVEGREADARSDIFALGSVLYEMATGKRAFEGKSQRSIALAILEKDPEPISTAQPMTPPALDYVVRTCLAKDPEERWQSAHDIVQQLRWIAEGHSSIIAPPAPIISRRKLSLRAAWILAGAMTVIAVLLAVGWYRAAGTSKRPLVASITAPQKTRFFFTGDTGGPPVISPDGSAIAYTALDQNGGSVRIWVRNFDSEEARVLNGTDGASFPFWSPDSRDIGFFADVKVKYVSASGGPIFTLGSAPAGRGGSWLADGSILLEPDTRSPIMRLLRAGEPAQRVTKLQLGGTTHRWPRILPDGKHFLYLAASHTGSSSENEGIYFASLDGKEDHLVVNSGSQGVYASGYLFFLRENSLFAQAFDPSNGKLSGEPKLVAQDVLWDAGVWHSTFDVSENGLLILQHGTSLSTSRMAWVDFSGKRLESFELPAGMSTGALSPNGKIFAAESDPGSSIWTFDLERHTSQRLTFDRDPHRNPVWSTDGKYLYYRTDSPSSNSRDFSVTFMRRSGVNLENEEKLFTVKGDVATTSVSPDAKYLVGSTLSEIFIYSLPDGKVVRTIGGPYHAIFGVLSPDGKWLAYVSDQTGENQVYVTSFPQAGPILQASISGGMFPRWAKGGRQLIFSRGSALTSIDVTPKEGHLELGSEKILFQLTGSTQQFPYYEASPDGKRILTPAPDEEQEQPITVISDWKSIVKR